MTEPDQMTPEKASRIGVKWVERIRASEERERDWRRDAEAAEKAFAADTGVDSQGKLYDFNILHSNIETIVPAIYNSTPVPDIRVRNNDPDQIAKHVGTVLERAIGVMVDDNRLDAEIEAEAQDSFLSGRGVIRLRFDADFVETVDPETGEPIEQPSNERITFEAWSWRDVRFGPARRWDDVGWFAFRHNIPREEVDRITDAEIVSGNPDERPPTDDGDDEDVQVWEIWCKDTRTVKFVREADSRLLSVKDDPLGLPGFFPVPEPVQPIKLTGKMTPVCPFSVYRRLADELDLVTKRIMKITSGLKVRGVTYGNAQDVAELAQADDNEIRVSTELEQVAITGGLDKAIAWWPVEQAIKVLQQLYVSRDQIRQAIYEITGISDIVRGASNANETLGAQQIKTQWGSLRIQKMQRLIQRQVRDVFVLMTEIMVRHFSPETLMQMSGLQLGPEHLQFMTDQALRDFRVDVESDSTIRADMTRIKGEMTEFLNGTAQYFGTMAQVVQAKPEMAGPAATIYAAFARNFKLGKQAEDSLEAMEEQARQPQEPQENPEAQAAQAEAQAKGKELELKAQEMQQRSQIEMGKLQLDARKLEMEGAKSASEAEIKRAELGIKQTELQIKGVELQLKRQELGQRAEEGKMKGDLEREKIGASREALKKKSEPA